MLLRKLLYPTVIILLVVFSVSAQKNGKPELYRKNKVASVSDYIIRHNDGIETGDSTLFSIEYLNKQGVKRQFVQYNDSTQFVTDYGLKFDTLCVQINSYSLPSNKRFRKEFYLHDKKGNKIETYYYRDKKKVISSKFKYDRQNRKLESMYFFDGKLKIINSYKYLNKGEIVVIQTIYEDIIKPNSIKGIDNTVTNYYSGERLDSSILVDKDNNLIEKSIYNKPLESGLEITDISRDPAHAYFHTSEFPPFLKRDTKTSTIKNWFDKNGLIVRKEEFHDGKLHWSNRYYYAYY